MAAAGRRRPERPAMTAHQLVYEMLPMRARYYVFWRWSPERDAATQRIFDHWATEKRTSGTLYHEGEAYVGGLRKSEMARLLEDLAFGEGLISKELLGSPYVQHDVRFEWGRGVWTDAFEWYYRPRAGPFLRRPSPKDWEPKRKRKR